MAAGQGSVTPHRPGHLRPEALVGDAGVEPAMSGPQNRRLTIRPIAVLISYQLFGG